MTRKQALLTHLAEGGKLSIMNGYRYFGISNISREVRRLVEIPLGIELKREKKVGKTKYKSTCSWFEYSAKQIQIKTINKALKQMCYESNKN
jgi:hypothetical protein